MQLALGSQNSDANIVSEALVLIFAEVSTEYPIGLLADTLLAGSFAGDSCVHSRAGGFVQGSMGVEGRRAGSRWDPVSEHLMATAVVQDEDGPLQAAQCYPGVKIE